jgi:hypothetical protein
VGSGALTFAYDATRVPQPGMPYPAPTDPLVQACDNTTLEQIPEPGVLALLMAGVSYVGLRRRREG